MADNPRLEELRRRVQQDPASIAFAQLAEELRRLGQFEEAAQVARAGLGQHPAYVSARVTLGRSLLELGSLDEAQAEFEQVLAVAPDNLVALRSMADLHQRRETAPVDFAPPPLPIEATQVTEATQATQHPYLAALEHWLAAILANRARA